MDPPPPPPPPQVIERRRYRLHPGLWLDRDSAGNDVAHPPVCSGHGLLAPDGTPPVLPPAVQACLGGAAERRAPIPTDRSPLR